MDKLTKLLLKFLQSRGYTLIETKLLLDLLDQDQEKKVDYPHFETIVSTIMNYDNSFWTVNYILEERRSKDAEKWENTSQSFKAIDRDLSSALVTVQQEGNNLVNSLAKENKTLFDVK